MDMIGVVGLGLLGRGIAACLLAHGYRVVGFTVGEAHSFERACDYTQKAMEELGAPSGSWRERFVEAKTLAEFEGCSFAIESVLEDADVKDRVFDALEAVMGEDAPIGSNTSAIPIGRLQEKRKHPERVFGMHWSPPAYVTRFLELIRGPQTNDETMRRALALGELLGKEPCVVKRDVPGFIANRMAYAMYREAVDLLERGVADAATIDAAFRNSIGTWASQCGPLRWIDITGGPALYAKAMTGVLPDLNSRPEVAETLEQLRREDARGVLNGRGFYEYAAGDEAVWEERLKEWTWALR